MNKNHIVTRLDKVRIKKILKKTSEDYPELLNRIETSNIIDALDVPNDLVTMNCQIRCEELNTKKITEVTLVYPRYADESSGNISVLSNFGIALFAARVGQTIQFQSSHDIEVSMNIIEILYQPEDAGHYLI